MASMPCALMALSNLASTSSTARLPPRAAFISLENARAAAGVRSRGKASSNCRVEGIANSLGQSPEKPTEMSFVGHERIEGALAARVVPERRDLHLARLRADDRCRDATRIAEVEWRLVVRLCPVAHVGEKNLPRAEWSILHQSLTGTFSEAGC